VRTPSEVFNDWVAKLPARTGNALLFALRWLSWPWLILTFAGVLSDIQVVVSAIQAFVAWLTTLAPFALQIADSVGFILGKWREFVDPVREWLGSWLPFRIPRETFDLALLLLLPLIRYLLTLFLVAQGEATAKRMRNWERDYSTEVQGMQRGPPRKARQSVRPGQLADFDEFSAAIGIPALRRRFRKAGATKEQIKILEDAIASPNTLEARATIVNARMLGAKLAGDKADAEAQRLLQYIAAGRRAWRQVLIAVVFSGIGLGLLGIDLWNRAR